MEYFPDCKTQNINFILCCKLEKNIKRYKILLKLDKIINDTQISFDIENSIFEYSVTYITNKNLNETYFKPIYKNKYRTLIAELKKNKEFYNKIKNKIIDPKFIAYLTPYQIEPENWKIFFDKQAIRDKNAKEKAYTTVYQCHRCRKNQCTAIMYADRALDENMSICVTCLNCGYTWTV